MQLSAYVMTNKFLGPKQFCYKKGQNTQTALLNVIEDVKLAIEKRQIIVFDCITHKLLLQKLCKMGITGTALKWFFNYFQGRAQTVKSLIELQWAGNG